MRFSIDIDQTILYTDCNYNIVRTRESESSLIRTYVIGIMKDSGVGYETFFIDMSYQFLLSGYECYYALRTKLAYYFKNDDIIPTLFNQSVPFALGGTNPRVRVM